MESYVSNVLLCACYLTKSKGETNHHLLEIKHYILFQKGHIILVTSFIFFLFLIINLFFIGVQFTNIQLKISSLAIGSYVLKDNIWVIAGGKIFYLIIWCSMINFDKCCCPLPNFSSTSPWPHYCHCSGEMWKNFFHWNWQILKKYFHVFPDFRLHRFSGQTFWLTNKQSFPPSHITFMRPIH